MFPQQSCKAVLQALCSGPLQTFYISPLLKGLWAQQSLQNCFIKLLLCLLHGHRYEDALVLLLTEVLNRIQFRYNQAQLEELDDETLDDDVRSSVKQGQLQVQILTLALVTPGMSFPELVLWSTS